MTLKLIGSGFGRTGTMSTKLALEKLGFGPTHHMIEVIENPAQQPLWEDFANGGPVDWARVFAGYNSQVDFPGAAVWERLIAAFPAAICAYRYGLPWRLRLEESAPLFLWRSALLAPLGLLLTGYLALWFLQRRAATATTPTHQEAI